MWKRSISAMLSVVILFTSVAASAATGRIDTTVPATWRYGGSPNFGGADKLCATTSPNFSTVLASAETCVKAYIKRTTSPSSGTPVFLSSGPIEMNGTTGRAKRFTTQFMIGTRMITQISVLLYAYGDCGAEPSATMNPGGTACTRRETVPECVSRQMISVTAQKLTDQSSCDTAAAAETKAKTLGMNEMRMAGAATLATMQWVLNQVATRVGSFTVQGKVFSSATNLTVGVLTQLGWVAITNAADKAWTDLIAKHKTDCFAKASRDFSARQATVALACNAP